MFGLLLLGVVLFRIFLLGLLLLRVLLLLRLVRLQIIVGISGLNLVVCRRVFRLRLFILFRLLLLGSVLDGVLRLRIDNILIVILLGIFLFRLLLLRILLLGLLLLRIILFGSLLLRLLLLRLFLFRIFLLRVVLLGLFLLGVLLLRIVLLRVFRLRLRILLLGVLLLRLLSLLTRYSNRSRSRVVTVCISRTHEVTSVVGVLYPVAGAVHSSNHAIVTEHMVTCTRLARCAPVQLIVITGLSNGQVTRSRRGSNIAWCVAYEANRFLLHTIFT